MTKTKLLLLYRDTKSISACVYSFHSSTVSSVSVMIDDVECVVSTVSNTEVVCDTGPHMGSIDATVEVQISGNGIAQEVSTEAAT